QHLTAGVAFLTKMLRHDTVGPTFIRAPQPNFLRLGRFYWLLQGDPKYWISAYCALVNPKS
ncbi:MAG: hypothetical protein K9J37_20885, partial [Saprospiraceae bacterium]|nr:hypothetical protein [Saprospiraceae bacterium]MCF8252376.1 hypothetical protein [Saprospiraceae bacterium]MCF8282246.1 hypothetical protein [Bacteroidales bacterium]MCF8314000.1 hypothetical protein [Saprospiraceae bacterium]MCF8442706.1 hypothetical protein [Saprospiraceae bacterium]